MNDIFPKILISGSYNAFDEGWNGCGVYACSGLYQSQTYTTPWYIGSAIDFHKRILKNNGHVQDLENNSHDNQPLQDSWNKHGEENFVWLCLETCELGQELIREQYYFDLYRPFVDERGGFNIVKEAGKPPNRKGQKHTEEHKKKIGLAHKGKSIPDHVKKAISKANKGQARTKKSFSLISPEGELIHGEYLKKFALERNLNPQCLGKVINGHKLEYKGWILPENKNKDIIYYQREKEFVLLSPDQKIFKGRNVSKFAKEHKLDSAALNRVVSGGQFQHLGWRLVCNKEIEYQKNKVSEFSFCSPLGEVFTGNNISKFCREQKLNICYMCQVAKREKSQYKGWVSLI